MIDASPFNADELAAQALAGGGSGGGGIRPFMPAQHRDFFALLPYIFVGAVDADGWPLATILAGEPGFVRALDDVTLHIAAVPDAQDPAASALKAGQEIGVLGLDLSTRRRNRANGRIVSSDNRGLTIAVSQSFGNCPQYIQLRTVTPTKSAPSALQAFEGLDDGARALIGRSDTFFVASRSRADAAGSGGAGADISHRGGRPGFARLDGDTLIIPDFRGNRYFNTLGNLLGEPRASLLFVDFASGDLLQLQGIAEIDWNPDEEAKHLGAERLWRFTVNRGWRRPAALPLRWEFVDYSPMTLRTGFGEPGTASQSG